MSKNITHPRYPAWVVTAAWDAIHNRPMSAKRERRMCEALGIDPPPVMVETPACPDCEAIRALMDWLFENGLDVEVFDDIFAITGGADNREAQVFNEWYDRFLDDTAGY